MLLPTFIAGDDSHHTGSSEDNLPKLLPSEHPLKVAFITDVMGLGNKYTVCLLHGKWGTNVAPKRSCFMMKHVYT